MLPNVDYKTFTFQVAEKLNELYELCIDLEAHAELGCEITLNGNGYNSTEAVGVGRAVSKIMNFNIKQEDIEKEIKVLKKLYHM